MSEIVNISLNPFLVVVLQGLTEEEPTIVPKSWLCDNDSFVMWPPGIASKNTVRKKLAPGDEWLKYRVVQVYWRTATDDYQEANKYLEIAEQTSGEESITHKFAELQDPKKRKYRHQKDLNSDDSLQDPGIIKKIKTESVIQDSVDTSKNLASSLQEWKCLPEILTAEKSGKPDETTTESSKSEEPWNNTEKCDQVDDIDQEFRTPFTENNDGTGIPESTALLEIDDLLSNEHDKAGAETKTEFEGKSEKLKPRIISNERLENNLKKVLSNNKPVEIPDKQVPSTSTVFAIGNKAQLNQNINDKTTNDTDNERLGTSRATEKAENDTTNHARPQSSKANESSALKIDGGSKFKPEKFVALPMDEKLNVIGLQQQQIISNQAKLAVAMNTKKSDDETSTEQFSLSFDETISMKAFLPVEDADAFEAFDENLRDDTTFRGKVRRFLEPYISTTNWKETVRQLIRQVMCNEVQILYSCRGQKGKKPFNHTCFYELLEAAATKRPDKKYRAQQKQMLSYVSGYLKQAKARLSASTNQRKGGKKKGSKSNPSKGKSLMSKKEKQLHHAALNNQGDSGDADDSS